MSEQIEKTENPGAEGASTVDAPVSGMTNPDASFGSAAAFASAESQEILNLLSDSEAGSCCGGSCCSV